MSLQELRNRSRIVRDETQFKANTASRIGQLFMDIVDYLMTLVNASHTHSNKTVIDNLTDSIGNTSSQNGGKLMYRGQVIESSSGQVSSWIQTPVLSIVSSLPLSPNEGDRYIYLINNRIYEYNGVSWELDPATNPSAVSGSAVIVREDSDGESLNHIFIYENGSWVDRDSDYSSTRFLTNFDTTNGRHAIQFVGSPNSLTQSGFYYGSDNITGSPLYDSDGGLNTDVITYQVISIDILNCKQIAYLGEIMYVRDLVAGVWSEWVIHLQTHLQTQLENTCYIKGDIDGSDPIAKVFKTYEEAVSWIQDNGLLSSSNRWLIKANVLDSITLYDNIAVHAVDVTTVINRRDDNNATALFDDIKKVETYNINGRSSYFYGNYIDNFAGTGSFYGYLVNIGTVVTATSRVYLLQNCQISFIQSTHNRTTSLHNCQIGGTTTLSLGSISAYNCQFAGIITQSGGSLDVRACQGNITQSDGTLRTYNHQGTITRTGGTWENEGSNLNAEAFTGNLPTTVTDTQKLAEEVDELPIGLISISYDDLLIKVTNSELKPGASYLITDFRTVHHILDNSTSRTGDVNIGELEPLIVKAVTIDELDKEAISTVYPKDTIYYTINSDIRDIAFYNDGGSPVAGYKGQIYFRHDTIQNVSTWYDFRNVKFRRWLVGATAWVSESSYTGNDVVEYNDILYKCKVTHSGVSTTPDSDSTNWIKWLDKTVNWSWTSHNFQFYVGDTTISNLTMSNPVDLFTFGDYYEHVKDTSIGRNDLNYLIEDYGVETILNNIVFNTTDNIATCLSNTFGELCFNNTIGNNFKSNTIGNGFNVNTIGDASQFNTIGINLNSNIIGNMFSSNTIGNDFHSNIIGDAFQHNTTRNLFQSNIIGNSFQSNTIGNSFVENTIGNSFYFNTTGNGFSSNTIGLGFSRNTIGYDFKSNIIGINFKFNTIKSYIGTIDFTLATHVYGSYDCEIFKRLNGTVRLRYTNINDAILTVDPNV